MPRELFGAGRGDYIMEVNKKASGAWTWWEAAQSEFFCCVSMAIDAYVVIS